MYKRQGVFGNSFTHSLNEERQRSKEIEWDFTIGKANVLKDWDKFYQTFEVDYRGRIYNTEPFLNYQSNDVAKGLLLIYLLRSTHSIYL